MDLPKIERILAPVDFSQITANVLGYATYLAGLLRAEVTLMHTVFVPPLSEPNTWLEPMISSHIEQDLRLQMKTTAEAKLKDLLRECRQTGVVVGYRVVEGVPYVEIIKCAEEIKADLIVMGSVGHSALSHFLIGSTAERVVRRSRYHVFCVKPNTEK